MKSLLLILSRKRYFAPAWVFSSLNIFFGTWAIYIPTVKDKLEIDKASLGAALFFIALGAICSFPIAPRIINRIGVGKATRLGVLLTCLAASFPLLVPNYYLLLPSLYFMGLCFGLTDIAMNTLVTEIEREDNVKFMSAAHGFFSLGGIIAGLGSFLIPILNAPGIHMFGAIVLVLLVNLVLFPQYSKVKAEPIVKKPLTLGLFKPLLLLGLVSFIAMGSEGAVIDWSGLFLQEVSLAPEHLIGMGFLAFSTTMTIGRFLGDAVSSRFGSLKLVFLGASIAILGYVLVLTTNTLMAITGFALIGLGFSAIVPELFRIGGNVEGIESAQGVSLVAATGYSGFLVAPVILGFLAETFSLITSFIVLLCCAFVVLAAMGFLSRKKG